MAASDTTQGARRCSTCGINWPLKPVRNLSFDLCHSCQEPTDAVSNAKPLSDADAYKMAVWFIHERHYTDWDESHDPRRLDPANETDPHVLDIFKRAEDLLSSRLAEIA